MKGKLFQIIALLCIAVVLTSAQLPDPNHGDADHQHPGLSMSADLSVISQAKDVYLSSVLKQLNGLNMPNISLSGGDGYVRSNRIFVKQRSKNVLLYTDDTRNAYIIQVQNLYVAVRSQDFRYNMWFVPIKAVLDIEIANVNLDIEVDLTNTTVQYFDPISQVNMSRVIPQINITKCDLKLDPSKIKFNIGGSLIAQVADVILPMFTRIITLVIETQIKVLVQNQVLPALFNNPILETKGFAQVGGFLPKVEWINTTLDYAVDRFGIIGTQLQLAINGTIFNNQTTGYRVLPVNLPITQPFYDKNLNSSWQLFISTYLLEHFSTTILDEAAFDYTFQWDLIGDPYNLTTSSLECFFPMLTSEYGDNIPVDMVFSISKLWNITSNHTTRSLTLNLNMFAKAYLHNEEGNLEYFGMLEWFNGAANISIFSEGMFLKGNITQFAFESAFAQTEYGIARYETSPFLMNIAFFGGMSVVNKMLRLNKLEIPSKWGYFEMQDLTLDYYDNYLAMGISPTFKKFNASDWQNSSYYNNKTNPPQPHKNLTASQEEYVPSYEASILNLLTKFGQSIKRMLWMNE